MLTEQHKRDILAALSVYNLSYSIELKEAFLRSAAPRYTRPVDNYDKQIDEIMCWFNFDRVDKAMVALDWSWHDSDNPTPSMGEIKQHALKMLRDAVKYIRSGKVKDDYVVGCGGFEVSFRNKILGLAFQVDEWTYTGGDDD